MNKLWVALLMSVIGNITAWFHMQGQFKYEWAKSWWWIILGGVPISILFYWSTRFFYEYFGKYWYVRPVGFGLSTITFGILTWLLLGETPDNRTIVTLFLSALIIAIQLSHLFIK